MSKPIAEAKFYAMTAEAAVKNLQSDAGRGLSGSEAKKRLSIYGENRLQKGKKTSFAKKFMLQFGDFMVLILLIGRQCRLPSRACRGKRIWPTRC